jgi:TetR/AcrR family transcriptional regulator
LTRAKRDPERTRETILEAATAEFAANGLGGARADEIAARAGANKRMLYHYFGDKQGLYLAVLERTYDEIRAAEMQLHLGKLEPRAGMQRLIEFSFDYYTDHPHFVRLLDTEKPAGRPQPPALAGNPPAPLTPSRHHRRPASPP